MSRKLYIVAYDVRQPSRMASALRIVRGFASGGQKSAYECWLSDAEREELRAHLVKTLNLNEDSIAFFPLETRRPVSVLGIAVMPADPAFFYIG